MEVEGIPGDAEGHAVLKEAEEQVEEKEGPPMSRHDRVERGEEEEEEEEEVENAEDEWEENAADIVAPQRVGTIQDSQDNSCSAGCDADGGEKIEGNHSGTHSNGTSQHERLEECYEGEEEEEIEGEDDWDEEEERIEDQIENIKGSFKATEETVSPVLVKTGRRWVGSHMPLKDSSSQERHEGDASSSSKSAPLEGRNTMSVVASEGNASSRFANQASIRGAILNLDEDWAEREVDGMGGSGGSPQNAARPSPLPSTIASNGHAQSQPKGNNHQGAWGPGNDLERLVVENRALRLELGQERFKVQQLGIFREQAAEAQRRELQARRAEADAARQLKEAKDYAARITEFERSGRADLLQQIQSLERLAKEVTDREGLLREELQEAREGRDIANAHEIEAQHEMERWKKECSQLTAKLKRTEQRVEELQRRTARDRPTSSAGGTGEDGDDLRSAESDFQVDAPAICSKEPKEPKEPDKKNVRKHGQKEQARSLAEKGTTRNGAVSNKSRASEERIDVLELEARRVAAKRRERGLLAALLLLIVAMAVSKLALRS